MASSKKDRELAKIYREHVNLVWRVARRLGMTPAEAEDTVHEVFLVVHRRLDTFDHSRSLSSWLHGITRNVVLHQKRGVARRLRRHRDLAPAHDGSADPFGQADTRQLVETALAELDEDRRAVLVLADIEGLTAPEIAEALSLKLNTVYTRLRTARRQFEAAVQQLNGDERRKTHGA
jgi:RNA polymerase sigma-70 factor (ECF subfamily)